MRLKHNAPTAEEQAIISEELSFLLIAPTHNHAHLAEDENMGDEAFASIEPFMCGGEEIAYEVVGALANL